MKKDEVEKNKIAEIGLTGVSFDSDLYVPFVITGYDRVTDEPIGVVGGAVFSESGAYHLENTSFLGNVYRQIRDIKQEHKMNQRGDLNG